MVMARERLGAWAIRSKLTQRAAAKLLRIHYTHFNQLLTGRRSPSLDLAAEIERLTGIPAVAWTTTKGGKTRRRVVRTPTTANVGRV